MVNQEFLDYIRQQLHEGTDKEQIKQSLLENGWETVDVQEGFIAVTGESWSSHPIQETIIPLPPQPQEIQETQEIQIASNSDRLVNTETQEIQTVNKKIQSQETIVPLLPQVEEIKTANNSGPQENAETHTEIHTEIRALRTFATDSERVRVQNQVSTKANNIPDSKPASRHVSVLTWAIIALTVIVAGVGGVFAYQNGLISFLNSSVSFLKK